MPRIAVHIIREDKYPPFLPPPKRSLGLKLCWLLVPVLLALQLLRVIPSWVFFVCMGVATAAVIWGIVARNVKSTRALKPFRQGKFVCWQCGQGMAADQQPIECPACGTTFELSDLIDRWNASGLVKLKMLENKAGQQGPPDG